MELGIRPSGILSGMAIYYAGTTRMGGSKFGNIPYLAIEHDPTVRRGVVFRNLLY